MVAPLKFESKLYKTASQELPDKITRFSLLEMEKDSTSDTIVEFWKLENIKIPDWCALLVLIGIHNIRGAVLDDYLETAANKKQPQLFPEV